MSTRIGGHIRSNVAAYLVGFLALTVSPVLAAGDVDRAPAKKKAAGTTKEGTEGAAAAELAALATELHCDTPCVQTSEIADTAITMPKLANLAVTTAKLANNAVRSTKIANDAVGASEILDGSVGAGEILAGAVGVDEIAGDAVTSAKIPDNAVTFTELANNAVGSAEVSDGALTAADVADATLTGVDIADFTIGGADINQNQVQSRVSASCPAGQSISAIATNGTVSCEVDDTGGGGGGAATDVQCASSCISTSELALGAVTNDRISPSAVTNDKIADNGIGNTAKIAPFTITGQDLALQTITASTIQTGAIGSAQINDNSIVSDDVSNLTSGDIQDDSLSGLDINETTLAPVCPRGALRDGVCVEHLTPSAGEGTTWRNAITECTSRGMRIPDLSEALLQALRHDDSLTNGYFWTADVVDDTDGGGSQFHNVTGVAENLSGDTQVIREDDNIAGAVETVCVATPR